MDEKVCQKTQYQGHCPLIQCFPSYLHETATAYVVRHGNNEKKKYTIETFYDKIIEIGKSIYLRTLPQFFSFFKDS